MSDVVQVLLGPMIVGTVLNVWFLGFMFMQCHTYYLNGAKKDHVWVRMLVAFLLLADTVNATFDIIFTYDYAVNKFGDVASLARATWVFNTDPVMTVIISSTVQSFFGWRVVRLTGQLWLGIFIWASSLAQFLCGLGTAIGCGIVKEFVEFQRFKSIVIVWLVLAPITDTVITFSLVWFLRNHKTGFSDTDDLVSRIVRLTIQTGMITAVWSAVDLSVFLIFPNNLHLILNMPLAKLYTNCLMSSLNARTQWSSASEGTDSIARKAPTAVHVNITTKSDALPDDYELDTRHSGMPLPSRGLHYNPTQKSSGGRPNAGRDVKLPPGDNLSLHSDDIESEYDSASRKAGGRGNGSAVDVVEFGASKV